MRIVFAVTATLIAYSASAHHSAVPHFDTSQQIVLDGVVTDFQFVNPHGYFYFDVTSESGEISNWRCELAGATGLRRRGWTEETLVPGQRITVNGSPARREDNHCFTSSFTLEDGTEISRNADLNLLESATTAEDEAEDRPQYLDNGQPNLSGPWVSQGRGGGMGPGGAPGGAPGMGPGGPSGRPAATAAGSLASADYEQIFDDPAIFCHPANIIFGLTHDQHVNDIYQDENTITLQYGYMDLVRTIHLDATAHPDVITPNVAGHSIGWWENDVLVVDTIGFEQGLLVPLTGLMHSAEMHVVERFRYDAESNTLRREFTAHDPSFLQSDYTGENTFALTNEPYEPYNCTELSGDNNRRPEDQ
jgi:hypothetical protein